MPRFLGSALDIPAATTAAQAVRKQYVDSGDAALAARIATLESGSSNDGGQTLATKNANTAVTALAGDFILADTTLNGSFTVTLPANPATNTAVAVKKVDNANNIVTVVGAGSSTIDGDSTLELLQAQSGAVMVYDGANWRVEATVIFDPGAKNFTYRGPWATGVSYAVNDVVYYARNGYVAKVGNTSTAPTVDANDSTWGLIARHGDDATITVGTVTSGATPSVTNSGTTSAPVFDFVFPKGDTGAAATVGVGTVTGLAAGAPPTVTNSGTSSAAVFDFGIPVANSAIGGGLTTVSYVNGSPFWNPVPGEMVLVDDTTSPVNVYLPAGAPNGSIIGVRKADTGTQTHIVHGTGQTGDGDTTALVNLSTPGSGALFMTDGFDWYAISDVGGTRWRGGYDSTAKYNAGDIVTFFGKPFVCTAYTGSITGNGSLANSPANDFDSWRLMDTSVPTYYGTAVTMYVNGTYLFNASGGAFTVKLPDVPSNDVSARANWIGQTITAVKVDSSTNTITVDPNGNTLDTAAHTTLSTRGDTWTLMYIDPSTGWVQVGGNTFQAAASGSTTAGYTHTQSTPAAVWTIAHGLGFDPAGVTVISVDGDTMDDGVVQYLVSGQTLRLSFDISFAGTAYLS